MAKDFRPPSQRETHAYVYDLRTGEVLAQHTHWIDEGAEVATEAIPRELIESIAKDSGRPSSSLGVLKVASPPPEGPVRVDVKTRRLSANEASEDGSALAVHARPRP